MHTRCKNSTYSLGYTEQQNVKIWKHHQCFWSYIHCVYSNGGFDRWIKKPIKNINKLVTLYNSTKCTSFKASGSWLQRDNGMFLTLSTKKNNTHTHTGQTYLWMKYISYECYTNLVRMQESCPEGGSSLWREWLLENVRLSVEWKREWVMLMLDDGRWEWWGCGRWTDIGMFDQS